MALVLPRHDLARRSPVVALILVLHGAFLYLLATGIRFDLPRVPPPLELVEVPALARPAPPPAIAARVVAPAVDPRRPIGRPPYPAQSARLGQEGLVRIGACVLPDGRLADVQLATSSGHALLDEAARRHLSRPGVRLAPGTRDGVAVRMCTVIPVRFTIADR